MESTPDQLIGTSSQYLLLFKLSPRPLSSGPEYVINFQIADSLSDSLYDSLNDSLSDSLSDSLYDSLSDCLSDSLND